mgnify:CR=1 FL=1
MTDQIDTQGWLASTLSFLLEGRSAFVDGQACGELWYPGGELELTGASAISALHTALRIRVSNKTTAAALPGAELRGADIEVINDVLANATAFPNVTGLQVGVTNASNKTIANAIGLKVKMNNPVDGIITNPFSIYTEGAGAVHLEDFVEVKRPGSTPGTPAPDFVRLYPKADGKLRPLGIAALEDKIVQQATRTILECIYEEDFLGFSYGFRPGRSAHRALDAARHQNPRPRRNCRDARRPLPPRHAGQEVELGHRAAGLR